MNLAEKVRILLLKSGRISEAELARRMGITPQNLHYKLKKNNLSEKDLLSIADAMGCQVSLQFVLPNGETV